MRSIYPSKLHVFSLSLTIFFIVISGCNPVQIKKINAHKDDYYKFTSKNAGLRISVDPYREEQRLQDFFGCDLLSRKVLPVFVVIENLSAEDGYVLLKEKTRLVMKNTSAITIEDNGGYRSDELKKAVEGERVSHIVMGGLGAIAPITIIVGLPVMIVAEKKAKDEFAIQRNIQEKQLVDKTLYRGGSNSGFLYFPLDSKEDITRIGGFSLSMQNVRTKEVVAFIIDVE